MKYASAAVTYPSITSAGLMITYKCSNACKHCVYRCSPKNDSGWISQEDLEQTMLWLKQLPNFHGLHIAGGEATLSPVKLVAAISQARKHGIPIEYLETNAFICRDFEKTCRLYRKLRDAGLSCIMISVSMYHLEFVPIRNTRNAIRAAEAVFGPGGYFIYPSHLWSLLQAMPHDGRFTLAEFIRHHNLSGAQLLQLFPLIPLGWVPDTLAQFYPHQPYTNFLDSSCADRLLSPFHAHIDLHGNIFTGSCCGISPFSIHQPPPATPVDPQQAPIFTTLVTHGPGGLLPLAREYGFTPSPQGYISKCHFCYHLRRTLHATGKFPELRPRHFYTLDYPSQLLSTQQ
ncbi:MAG: 4Fe-4S cluster-binding domain-containing protein [Lentisphaerae bacterium]|nr:MAG: 4Fe-4S cluster-binding domain-containing protein [Lentisphaerota bacterium]